MACKGSHFLSFMQFFVGLFPKWKIEMKKCESGLGVAGLPDEYIYKEMKKGFFID